MENRTPPLISVIIPYYNTAPYLARCLDSLLEQTEPAFEALVIDDGSSDGGADVVEDFAMKDSRFHLLQNRENLGVSESRNRGLEQARGKYIFFMDSDDFIAPRTLELLLDAAIADEADFVRAMHLLYYPGKNQAQVNWLEEMNQVAVRRTRYADVPSAVFIYSSSNALFRRQHILETGLQFDAKVKIGEDRLFNLQFLSTCGMISFLKGHTYYWVRRENMSDQASRSLLAKPKDILLSSEKAVLASNRFLRGLQMHRRWLHMAVFYELVNYVILPMGSRNDFGEKNVRRLIELLESLEVLECDLAEPHIKARQGHRLASYQVFFSEFYQHRNFGNAVTLAKKAAQ